MSEDAWRNQLGYAAFMVFLFLFTAVGLTVWALASTVHDTSGRIPRGCIVYNWSAQALILVLGGMDWAYSIVEVPLYQLMGYGHLATYAIFLPALLLVLILPWRARTWSGVALVIHGVQALTFIPALLYLEKKTDISFLSWITFIALTLSCTSALLALSPVMAYGAREGNRFHKIAYKDRWGLVTFLEQARQIFSNVQWNPPTTFLDAGTIAGENEGRKISVHTRFSFFPLGYGLDFQVTLPSTLSDPEPADFSTLKEKYSEHLAGGRLVCAQGTLQFQQINMQGTSFDTRSAQALMSIADELESKDTTPHDGEKPEGRHDDPH